MSKTKVNWYQVVMVLFVGAIVGLCGYSRGMQEKQNENDFWEQENTKQEVEKYIELKKETNEAWDKVGEALEEYK